ncbi:MAG: hypothetical protein ACE15E_02930 [Acidobacteriota bacterium]
MTVSIDWARADSRCLIDNATVVLPGSVVLNQSLLIENGKVERIAPAGQMTAEVDQRFDLHGQYLVPGFIDL